MLCALWACASARRVVQPGPWLFCAPQHREGALMQHGDERTAIHLLEIGQSRNPGLAAFT